MMYSKGEGTDKNPVAAKVGTKILLLTFHCFSSCQEYGDIASEMMNQLKDQQRIAFQEGSE